MYIKKALILEVCSLVIISAFFNFSYAQKQGVTLEDEMGEPEDTHDTGSNVIDKEEIVVEGEDEQIIEPKHNKEFIKGPKDSDVGDWEEGADKIIKKEKKGTKKIEKRAQIKTEYGLYNTLGVDIYVTKKDDFGLYLLEYIRLKKDSEGREKIIFPDSEISLDNLNFVSHFNISQTYRLMMKVNYDDDLHGLQNESSYSKQFKRGAQLEIQNQFRPGISQKLNISAIAQYIGSDLEENIEPKTDSSYHKAEVNAAWQYIFGRRNSLSAEAKFWYAEMKLHNADGINRYRSGLVKVWDIFPVYKGYMGADKKPWEMNLTLGVKSFFANNMNTAFGPYLVFDNFIGDWHSKILFERNTQIPSSYEYFIHKPYSNLTYFEKPLDEWNASWKNTVSIGKNTSLKLESGYSYFKFYYEPAYEPDGLYQYNFTLFRLAHMLIAWEQNLSKEFYYEIGAKGEYQIDKVNLRPEASGFVKTNYTLGTWDFGIEAIFTSRRMLLLNEKIYLKHYTMLNVIIDKKINPTVSLFIRGENLLNQQYVLFYPYKTSGAKGYLGLNILF